MFKKKIFLLVSGFCLLLCFSCTTPPEIKKEEPKEVEFSLKFEPSMEEKKEACHNFSFSAMGTLWKVLYCSQKISVKERELEKQILSLVSFYDETFSNWSQKSELVSLQNKGFLGKVYASKLFIEGLSLADTLYMKTRGVFDISLGNGNFSRLKIEKEKGYFSFSKAVPKKLDFNGLVKGMAVGDLALLLYKSGFKDFYINAGNGNLAFRVTKTYKDYFSLEKELFKKGSDKIYFLSQSKTLQSHKGKTQQHIHDPRKEKKLDAQKRVICYSDLQNSHEWVVRAGISDAMSTALTLESELGVPPFCFKGL